MFLATGFAILRPTGPAAFSWLVYAAPNALFPLMTLFLWLDTSRYGAYLPLLLAGKCIGVFSLLGWSIVFRRMIMIEELLNGAIIWLAPQIIEGILLCGDFLAIAAVLIIIKNTQAAVSGNGAAEYGG